jgi:hypothetical protein
MRVSARVPVVCLFLAIAAAAPASAQEAGSVGLSIGHPTAVGVAWQVTDRIAVRPEVDLAFGGAEYTMTFGFFGPGIQSVSSTTTADVRTVGLGVSALFTVFQQDSLSVYVSPQYQRLSATSRRTETTDVMGTPITTTEESTDGSYEVSGALGVRYRFGNRFGVFGEVGLAHERDNDDLDSTIGELTENRYSNTRLRSGVGVVLWF